MGTSGEGFRVQEVQAIWQHTPRGIVGSHNVASSLGVDGRQLLVNASGKGWLQDHCPFDGRILTENLGIQIRGAGDNSVQFSNGKGQ
jgi:hypothetical protein